MRVNGWLHASLAEEDGGVRASLVGEIDPATAPVLRRALGDAITGSAGDVTIDLSGVAFIDCAGVRELMLASSRLDATGRRVVVSHPQGPVARVLALCEVDALPNVEIGERREVG